MNEREKEVCETCCFLNVCNDRKLQANGKYGGTNTMGHKNSIW